MHPLLQTPFCTLYHDVAFGAYLKMAKLARASGRGRKWDLDRDASTLKLGRVTFPVQFLGTESAVTETWQWADAEVQRALTPDQVRRCVEARNLGRVRDADSFGADKFPLTNQLGQPDGRSMAAVCCELTGASAFYPCEHDDGVVWVLLDDPRINGQALAPQDWIDAFNSFLFAYPCDHRHAVERYVRRSGMTVYEATKLEVSFELTTGELMSLTVKEFDEDTIQTVMKQL